MTIAPNRLTTTSNATVARRLEMALLALACLAMFFPVLVWMWGRWFARDSYYSHGILVPFVSLYMVWQQRRELAQIPCQRSPWGMVLIAAGTLAYVVSALLRIYFSSAFSLLAVIVGLILHLYGPRMLRAVLFPVVFLIAMMPLPLVFVVNVSFKMKIFAAEISERLLNAMGLFAIRQGSVIKMQHAYVVVEDVCSGLRSLISLTALGSIFAFWLLKGPIWKRVLLFVLTMPVAIVTNVCRVVILSAVSEIWGPQYASGTFHDLTGFLLFFFAFLMFFGIWKIVE